MNRQKFAKASLTLLIAFFVLPMKGEFQQAEKLRFAISFPAERGQAALDGRVLLMISTDGSQEPRTQINDGPKTQQIFGIDAESWKPGQKAVIDASVLGYPVRARWHKCRRELTTVQAVLHKYETFKRSDGHTVKLPMDRGEGPALEPCARQSHQQTPNRSHWTRTKPDDLDHRARSGDSGNRTGQRYQVHQARQDPEREADEVLGPADVSRRLPCSCRTALMNIPKPATR